MSLTLWKGPVVDDAEAAQALLDLWYEKGDDSAFEPSADIALVADELLRRFPDDDETGPWADMPFGQTDRLLDLSIRWSADDAVIDAICELAREHRLVLYDPQGPDIHCPDDPLEPAEDPPIPLANKIGFWLMFLGSAGLIPLGWWLPVPVLNWLLMLVGAFLTFCFLSTLYIVRFAPREPEG